MKRILYFLGTGLGMFIPILVLYFEIAGIYHSADKHSTKDVMVSVFVPPWAWYRSIEMFWHDDSDNIDWNKRLTADMNDCTMFLQISLGKDSDIIEYGEAIDYFSTKIKTYPKDKQRFLREGCAVYVQYLRSVGIIDLRNAMDQYYITGTFSFVKSQETISLENQLVNHYKVPDALTVFDKQVQDIAINLKAQGPLKCSNLEIEFLRNELANKTASYDFELERLSEKIINRIFN